MTWNSFSRRSILALGLATIAFAGAPPALAQDSVQQRPSLDVPFVPTPQTVVDKMIELGEVKKGDFLIDLGSGDGRIPVTAAKKIGIEALGVDIDPRRIEEAKENAKKEGVEDKVEFRQENLFNTDLSKATVITMYLLDSVNEKLKPTLMQLKPGTRIVSHAFDLSGWEPEKTEKVDGRTIYMWTVPERGQQQGAVTPSSN